MGHSRRVGPIRSAYDDAERITMRGTGGDFRRVFSRSDELTRRRLAFVHLAAAGRLFR